jgi:hypothetical protein
MRFQTIFTHSKRHPKVEFPICYQYTFNHLKAQQNSNGKTKVGGLAEEFLLSFSLQI